MHPGRFHVTASSAGRPFVHGWWAQEDVARGTFTRRVGQYGNLPDARVTLRDEDAGEVLTSWPDEAAGPATL